MAWSYVPALAPSDSESGWPSLTTEPCALWNTKPLSAQSWLRASRTAPYLRSLSGLTAEPSTVSRGVASWISSLRASRASRGVSPDSAAAWTTSGGFGTTFSESFARYDPDSSSWKTCQASFLAEDSDPSSQALPKAGSMRNGSLYARRTPALRINANESSSWPTPDTVHGGGGGLVKGTNIETQTRPDGSKAHIRLQHLAELWATPMASDGTKPSAGNRAADDLTHQSMNWATPTVIDANGRPYTYSRGNHDKPTLALTGQAQAWPTPSARDWKSGEHSEETWEKNSRPLNEAASRFTLPVPPTLPAGEPSLSSGLTSRRRLNPRFVAWLMNLPPWWVDPVPHNSALSAMQSYRSRQQQRLCSLLGGQGLSSEAEQ